MYESALIIYLYSTFKIVKDYQVYVDLFSSFWTGGLSEHIDHSDSAVFVNAFTECTVYMAATVRYLSCSCGL
jgi:hypothetical protein